MRSAHPLAASRLRARAFSLLAAASIAYFNCGNAAQANAALLKAQHAAGPGGSAAVGEWLDKCKAALGAAFQPALAAEGAAQPAAAVPVATKPKYDWYQSDLTVVIDVMIKNLAADAVRCDFAAQSLSFLAQVAPDAVQRYERAIMPSIFFQFFVVTPNRPASNCSCSARPSRTSARRRYRRPRLVGVWRWYSQAYPRFLLFSLFFFPSRMRAGKKG